VETPGTSIVPGVAPQPAVPRGALKFGLPVGGQAVQRFGVQSVHGGCLS